MAHPCYGTPFLHTLHAMLEYHTPHLTFLIRDLSVCLWRACVSRP